MRILLKYLKTLRGIQKNGRRYVREKSIKLERLFKQKSGNGNKHCHQKRRNREQNEWKLNNDEFDPSTMINISNVPLSEDEIKLLSRGFSFFPKPSQIDQFQLREDVKQFFRRLRLREFFYWKRQDRLVHQM